MYRRYTCEPKDLPEDLDLLLNLSDLSDEPLHHQISRQLRAKILAGALQDGAGLPSIRGLARECRVSVITVQRAYDDLEREALIQARRGKGFFVRALDADTKNALAQERFREALTPIVREGRAEGLDPPQMRALFDELLDDDPEATRQPSEGTDR